MSVVLLVHGCNLCGLIKFISRLYINSSSLILKTSKNSNIIIFSALCRSCDTVSLAPPLTHTRTQSGLAGLSLVHLPDAGGATVVGAITRAVTQLDARTTRDRARAPFRPRLPHAVDCRRSTEQEVRNDEQFQD